jgi:hypothetical protein
LALAAALLTGCGGGTTLLKHHSSTSSQPAPVGSGGSGGSSSGGSGSTRSSSQKLDFPAAATKNTTRVAGSGPVADAAGVALAVFPSAAPGTHPTAVALASTGDWQAAIAASVLMAPPIRAPLLFADGGQLPAVSREALGQLAPTGAGAANGAQVIRIGDVASPSGLRTAAIKGSDPYALAAEIDRFVAAADGRTSINVVIASGTQPAYAMPAAGWAAESGEPILFVDGATIPAATRQALMAHQKPHIYVLGPPSVIPNSTLKQLGRYGTVKRISGASAAATSVAFAKYRDPACTYGQPCAHVPGSFGWAIESPGHGYVLLNGGRPLDAAAAAPLSSSGAYGPALLTDNPSTLPSSVLNYFLNYATPGYSQEGPTAAVYNHGWVIGDPSAISLGVQAQMDALLEVVPQK